jgi:hypothetical protein
MSFRISVILEFKRLKKSASTIKYAEKQANGVQVILLINFNIVLFKLVNKQLYRFNGDIVYPGS